MGYDLHITRAEFWAENNGDRITEEEWLRVIERDNELAIDEANGPLFAVWGEETADYSPWLNWSDGNIFAKNPDKNTLAKMLQVADTLGATVQGDDGETYSNLDDYPESLGIGGTDVDSSARHERDLPLPVRREVIWNKREYILVAVVVLLWIIYDLARG